MKKEYYGVMALSKMYAQENGVSLKDAEKHIKATFNLIEKALKDKLEKEGENSEDIKNTIQTR